MADCVSELRAIAILSVSIEHQGVGGTQSLSPPKLGYWCLFFQGGQIDDLKKRQDQSVKFRPIPPTAGCVTLGFPPLWAFGALNPSGILSYPMEGLWVLGSRDSNSADVNYF